MSEHYDRVLAVKQEIMGRRDIRGTLIENYAGFYKLHSDGVHSELGKHAHGRQMPDRGQNRFLFRAGQLSNGALLVHKLFILVDEAPFWRFALGNECQEAAEMLEKGLSVPYVTMVVVYEGIYSTLTTDVTEGGLHTIVGEGLNSVRLRKNDGTIEEIETDLKRETPKDEEDAKRYLEEAMLIL